MFKYVLLATAVFGLAAAASVDSDVHAEVKSLDNDISPEGNFHYGFQSSNGIELNAAGNGDVIQGTYKFVSPDGQVNELSYVADAEGYKPSGANLPTPPPIPEAIIRSIQWNEAHPSSESDSKYNAAPVPGFKPRQF